MSNKESVKVIVRVRPMSQTEINENYKNVIEVRKGNEVIITNNQKITEKNFIYDSAYEPSST